MSDVAVRAENVGKMFRVTSASHLDNMSEALTGSFKRLIHGSSRSQEFWALKDVSFDVRDGEILGILGHNGAGKSTLLKILSRITRLTKGEIEINGRVGSLIEVGTGFHPELTGRENIYFNGALLGMKRGEIQKNLDEIVDFSGVSKFLDTPVKRYSSGMQARLGFAVAAHLQSDVLIVDEVLSVGDFEFQKKCLGKMKSVAKGGRTVLFVSHNMNAMQQLCSRAIWLDHGSIRMDSRDVRTVTLSYLTRNEGAAASQWVNSGHDYQSLPVVPLRLWLGDEKGAPIAGPTANNDDVWVYIEMDVRDTDPALTIGYALYTEDGEPLYWSYQTDGAPEEWPVVENGTVRLRTQLPKRVLNEGTYRLELLGGLHHREWFFEPGASRAIIGFEVQGGLSDSPLWLSRRPGLLAPALNWERIGKQPD